MSALNKYCCIYWLLFHTVIILPRHLFAAIAVILFT